MSELCVQVFGGDPVLAPYLAHYLQTPSCNIREDEGLFYLGSSYFEKLPYLPTPAQRKRVSAGIAAVIDLIDPTFDTLALPEKVEACQKAVLGVLNGVIKLKYRRSGILTYSPIVAPPVVGHGSSYTINSSGQRIYTRTITIPTSASLTNGAAFFRAADRSQPSMKKVWNIARKNASVARALYHYAQADGPVAVRATLEELKGYIKARKPPFNAWIGPEVSESTMDEVDAVLHNALLSGEKALHSMARADTSQAAKYKGTTMLSEDVTNILHTLLWKWVTQLSQGII